MLVRCAGHGEGDRDFHSRNCSGLKLPSSERANRRIIQDRVTDAYRHGRVGHAPASNVNCHDANPAAGNVTTTGFVRVFRSRRTDSVCFRSRDGHRASNHGPGYWLNLLRSLFRGWSRLFFSELRFRCRRRRRRRRVRLLGRRSWFGRRRCLIETNHNSVWNCRQVHRRRFALHRRDNGGQMEQYGATKRRPNVPSRGRPIKQWLWHIRHISYGIAPGAGTAFPASLLISNAILVYPDERINWSKRITLPWSASRSPRINILASGLV
jgi:hypothetical protein